MEIKVADKPTLDQVAEDTAFVRQKLEAEGYLEGVQVFVGDYAADRVTVHKGTLDLRNHILIA